MYNCKFFVRFERMFQFFFLDFSRQYSVKHLLELRLEGHLKYSLCQKKGASVLCVTYYCKKIKKYVCNEILYFFFLSGLEPLALFCYFVSQSELLMNEVRLPAGEVANDRRITENNLLKYTNVNVTYVGFVVYLGK